MKKITSPTKKTTILLVAALLVLAGQLASVQAADIAKGDVTTTLWPGGAPYTFFDDASTGGGDTAAGSSINFDRSFGTLNVGASGAQIAVGGIGWASGGSGSFNATRVIATITYLGADGVFGGGDDVLIGKATNNVTADTTAGEWVWMFDNPMTNTIDGASNMFRINLTVDTGGGGTGTFRFKTTGTGTQPASAAKISVAGSSTALGGGDPFARKWVGGVDGNWDTSTTNWSDGVDPMTYADGKNVTFDDTLSVSPLNNYITLAGTYSPSNVVVNNTTYDYHLSGGDLAGDMTLTKAGANTLSLSMSNSYTGITTVNAGILELDDADALGSSTGGTVINTNSTLSLNNGITLSGEPITLNGNGSTGNNGALNSIDSVNPVTVVGPITLGSNARVCSYGANTHLIINSPITDNGNNYRLLLQNSGGSGGSINLNSASNTIGNLSFYGYRATYGLITFGADNFAPAALLTVGGGLFDLNGTSQQFAGIANGSDATYGVITNSSAALSTLTIDYSGNDVPAPALDSPICGLVNVVKNGSGTQTFGGGPGVVQSYSGTTVINNGILGLACDCSQITNNWIVNSGGTLRGIATIGGSVDVKNGGTFYAGYASNALGTLTLNGNLALQSGSTTVVAINPDISPSNDVFNVGGSLSYDGTLTIYNISTNSTPLAVGDTFTVFPPGGTGSFTLVGDAGPGLKFQFNDGVISVVNSTASYPTNISYQVNGTTMTLTWPETHLGWYAQSNSVSLSSATDWHDIPGSESGTNAVIIINPAKPQVFYRLSNTSQP